MRNRRETDRELRWAVRIVLLLFLAAIVIGGINSFVSVRVASDARDLAEQVDHNSRQIAKNEHEDITASFQALTRICDRDNLERAGHHWAYLQSLTSGRQLPATVVMQLVKEPALEYFLGEAAKTSKENLARTQRNLPILDCSPNLRGGPAVPLSRKAQQRYVLRWARGKLDPTPDPTRPFKQR